MSDQLSSQSRSNESGITRRTALRGAAWSASAVTVVVATPNIAAASTGTVTFADSSAYRSSKDQNTHYVIWTFTIKAGAVALTDLKADFSGVSAVTDLTVTSGTTTWADAGEMSRVYGTIPANGSLTVTARFTRTNNGNGTASVIISAGSPSRVLDTLTAGYTEQR
jgi:hypothetical protein